MKKVLTTLGLFAVLLLPTAIANAACGCGCDACAPSCAAPCCAAPCCAPCPCEPCPDCKIQCVTIPKKHFWNLKRTGYYVSCPCCKTGGAAPVCPTKIGECISNCVPSKMVIIPKRHFWEKERCQRMPLATCGCGCGCSQPACGCCD